MFKLTSPFHFTGSVVQLKTQKSQQELQARQPFPSLEAVQRVVQERAEAATISKALQHELRPGQLSSMVEGYYNFFVAGEAPELDAVKFNLKRQLGELLHQRANRRDKAAQVGAAQDFIANAVVDGLLDEEIPAADGFTRLKRLAQLMAKSPKGLQALAELGGELAGPKLLKAGAFVAPLTSGLHGGDVTASDFLAGYGLQNLAGRSDVLTMASTHAATNLFRQVLNKVASRLDKQA